MLMESVMRLRSGVQGHLFRIPSVHFQVSAFVCIYTIGDITTETKNFVESHEQIRESEQRNH